MLRIGLVAALIVAGMFLVKDGRALERAGLLGSCSDVAAPAGADGFWKACKAGKLEGRPNLARNACVSHVVVGNVEYWRCPAPVGSGRDL